MLVAALPVPADGEDAAAAPPPPGVPLAKSLPPCAVQTVTQASGLNASASSLIGLTSCRWTSLNPFGNASYVAADGTRKEVGPQSDVISLSVTDSKGKKVPLNELREPLVLAIPLSKLNLTQDELERMMTQNQVPDCRFWNVTESQWAGDGCKSMSIWDSGNGPELLCACTHLTSFAAFDSFHNIFPDIVVDVSEFLYSTIILCARVDALFSPEGMAALNRGEWVTRVSATVFFVPAILIFLKLMLTAVWDVRHRKDLPWIWAGMEHVAWPSCLSAMGHMKNFLFKPWRWPLRASRFAMETVVAYDLGMHQVTLKIVEEAKFTEPGYAPSSRDLQGRDPDGSAALVAKASRQMAPYRDRVKDQFLFLNLPPRGSVGRRRWAWLLLRRFIFLQFRTFKAVHPLMFPALIDLYSFSSQRVIALAIQFLGSLFGCALYYQQTTAIAVHSPKECTTTSFEQRLQKAIPISIVSAIISTCPSLLLYNMISARPRPDHWILQQKDRTMGVLFYFLGLCLCGFFLMYIAAFLANVSEESAESWMLSAAWTLASTVFLTPWAQSFFLVAWTVSCLYCFPTLADQIFWEGEESAELKDDPETPKGVTATTRIMVRSAADVDDEVQPALDAGQGSAAEPSAVAACTPVHVPVQETHLPGVLVQMDCQFRNFSSVVPQQPK